MARSRDVYDGDDWTGFRTAWHAAKARWPRMRVEVARYAATRADLAKTAMARGVDRAIIGGVAGVAGLTVLATAAALVVVGIAGALGDLFGVVWLGDLVTGVLLLGAVAIALTIFMKKKGAARFERLRDKYAQFDRESGDAETTFAAEDDRDGS